jgi:hypothetical protein
MKFNVNIKEVMGRTVEIDDENIKTAEDAMEKAIEMYKNGEIVLTIDDLLPDVTMSVQDETYEALIDETFACDVF